jgi:RHS repeat-associated protein
VRVERRVLATDALPASSDSYTTTAGTNRLASITTPAGTRSLSYDARGNLATETRPGAVTASTSYDGYARLIGYVRTGEASLSFTYNGMDDRVREVRGTVTRRYLYDGAGRILGEYGASATDVIAEHLWLSPDAANDNQPFGGDDGVGGYAPLAIASAPTGGTAQVIWVHGNHMGVPLVYTNSTGAVITPPSFTQSAFAGQMKTLADLYYNRYRDYDPSTGRYIQADPIGLNGDPNPYAYAMNNPLRYGDPEGLATILNRKGQVCRVQGGIFVCRQNAREDCPLVLPPPPPPIDYCGSKGTGWVPDRPFGRDISRACKIHDACYGKNSRTNRYQCDLGILVDSFNQCRGQGGSDRQCAAIGTIYFLGVRAGGWLSYERKSR